MLSYRIFMIIFFLLSCGPSQTHSDSRAVFDENGNHLPVSEADSEKVAWRPLDKSKDGITGVGILTLPILFGRQDMCTMFLLDTKVLTGPGYILTNAHCTLHHLGLNALKSDEVRTNESTVYRAQFNHFVGVARRERIEFRIRKIVYYTEFGTDLAVFEIDSTLSDLIDRGIKPLSIDQISPNVGQKVRLIGAPLLRLNRDLRSLHITSECQITGKANLKNGEYSAPNSFVHNCSSIEGFSGGPLIDVKTEKVVLINSHGDAGDSSDPICTYASRPCEVDENGGVRSVPEHNYGQLLDALPSCFNNAGVFNLELEECRLPR
jgi:hypothetical protein